MKMNFLSFWYLCMTRVLEVVLRDDCRCLFTHKFRLFIICWRRDDDVAESYFWQKLDIMTQYVRICVNFLVDESKHSSTRRPATVIFISINNIVHLVGKHDEQDWRNDVQSRWREGDNEMEKIWKWKWFSVFFSHFFFFFETFPLHPSFIRTDFPSLTLLKWSLFSPQKQ